jgi:hypothetical protein
VNRATFPASGTDQAVRTADQDLEQCGHAGDQHRLPGQQPAQLAAGEPSARSRPFSCLRSTTDRANVFPTPIGAMTTSAADGCSRSHIARRPRGLPIGLDPRQPGGRNRRPTGKSRVLSPV